MKRLLLIALTGMLGYSQSGFAQAGEPNTDFYYRIQIRSYAQQPVNWAHIENASFESFYPNNVSRWVADNCTPKGEYMALGLSSSEATAAIWASSTFPAINKIEVRRSSTGVPYTDIKKIRLLVSPDPDFIDDCTVYTPASNAQKDEFTIDNPVDKCYYKLEYEMPGIAKNYIAIDRISLYPATVSATPRFFQSDVAQVITEKGELRVHVCYYDQDWKPVADNTEWTGGDFTDASDYSSYSEYKSSDPTPACIAMIAMPKSYSDRNNVEAKNMRIWAQSYSNGEYSPMEIREYDETKITTGIQTPVADEPTATQEVSPVYYTLQGVRIATPAAVPAGSLYIVVDASGARKLIR